MQHALAPLSLTLLASPLLAQSVHVVDDDGGADFTDLPDAIAAASPGDVLLVRPGSYSSFLLSKSLTITAEADQTVDVGAFSVTGLGAGDRVVLRGLSVGPDGGAPTILGGNQGWLGLEDCVFAPEPALPQPALSVSASDSVFLVRCDVTGYQTHAIESSSTDLFLYGCQVTGGSSGTDGGDGLRLLEGSAFVSGGQLRGGDGNDASGGVFSCGLEPGDGGDGVFAQGALPGLTIQDAMLAGGTAGATAPGCGTAADGEAWDFAGTGIFNDYGGVARSLDVETPVSMGSLATNQILGAPGDLVVLAIALAPDATPFAPWLGVFAALDPLLVTPIGLVPGTGSLAVDIPVPFVAFEGLQLFEQAAFITPFGQIVLSTPSLPLVLDPTF